MRELPVPETTPRHSRLPEYLLHFLLTQLFPLSSQYPSQLHYIQTACITAVKRCEKQLINFSRLTLLFWNKAPLWQRASLITLIVIRKWIKNVQRMVLFGILPLNQLIILSPEPHFLWEIR